MKKAVHPVQTFCPWDHLTTKTEIPAREPKWTSHHHSHPGLDPGSMPLAIILTKTWIPAREPKWTSHHHSHPGLDPGSMPSEFDFIFIEHYQHCMSETKKAAVYILANKKNGTLYVGVTSDIIKRVWQHKNNFCPGFTYKYNIDRLVWYELHQNMDAAISREKALKNWKRQWKIEVIEEINPQWNDLYEQLVSSSLGFP